MRPPGKRHLVALVAVVGATAAGLAQSTKPEPTPTPAAPPIKLLLTSLVPDATLAFPGELRMAATPDGFWIASRATGMLTKVDIKTNKLAGTAVNVGKEPCHGLVFAFKSFWIPLCGVNALQRTAPPPDPPAAITAKTETKVAETKPLDAKPEGTPVTQAEKKATPPISTGIRGVGPLVTATGSVWMITDPKGSLVRIDPDTNAVVAEVTIGSGATNIVAGGDTLWITSSAKNVVTRVNGYSNVVEETVKVGPSPIAVATGEGSVWTLNGGDGTVSRIDPKTNKVTETIKVGATGTSGTILAAEGSIWVSTPGHPLSRIDPKTNRLAQQFTGPGGGVLAFGLKSLWLTATPTEVWRIDPKRVEATIRFP